MSDFLCARRVAILVACSCGVGIAALTQAVLLHLHSRPAPMFLAPMIGVIEPCILLRSADTGAPESDLAASCTGPQGSAAALVESTLSFLAPDKGTPGRELGYTLPVPLLQLFRPADGNWVIDQEKVARLVRTVRDTPRPAILYLFSNHFSVGAPIEEALAAEPANLSATPLGPLPPGTYYGAPIYNWSFASTQNSIAARRVQAVQAILDGMCALEPRHIAKIRGVTVLGELHHLFPDFEKGMGFSAPYLVSDYSEASRRGFRIFLRNKYGAVERLNLAMATTWQSFDQVEPPGKDIRSEPLRDFTEHIDSFAHGSLPISGWAYVKDATQSRPASIRIYRNGEPVGKVPVSFGRQDVLEALPELGDVNTGWRFDMDFRALPVGVHRIDVLLEGGNDRLTHLATRHVAIMARDQRTPQPMRQTPLPASLPPGEGIRAHVDLPVDQSSYFYNPLVAQWHEFRGQQVVKYLGYFADQVKTSCLAHTKRYTHQIIPFTNPGWDSGKFAIAASLEKLEDLRLGVSLYGEASYGTSFADWLESKSHRSYGVTEFHPLKAMDAAALTMVLDAHARHGAEFVSFFLEPRWKGVLLARGHNIFSLDPDNRKFNSDQLYRSMQEALAQTH